MASQQFTFPDKMNLRLAAVFLDKGEQRIRTLAREGEIPGAAQEEGVWMFSLEGLELYKEANAGTSRRTGGARKGDGKAFVIHIKGDNLTAAKAALASVGIELEQRYDYAKQKAYRIKRMADQKAVKAAKKAEPK